MQENTKFCFKVMISFIKKEGGRGGGAVSKPAWPYVCKELPLNLITGCAAPYLIPAIYKPHAQPNSLSHH